MHAMNSVCLASRVLSTCISNDACTSKGLDFKPAPDLDHANPVVRQGLKDWLSWLHTSMSFAGMRLDFAAGYGGNFVPEYVKAGFGAGSFNVGELWLNLNW